MLILDVLTAIAILAAAALSTYAVCRARQLAHEYSTWATEKSRSEHRARAYKEVRERRAIEKNRDEICRTWRSI